jgi:hypothetical protein
MDKKINSYSFKLWLTLGAVSFVLFQPPLYFFNYANTTTLNGGYGLVFWEFVKNWFYIMALLAISWAFVLRAIRAFYQAYWSERGFKLALLLVSEFLMLFFLVIYFCVFNSNYIIPTSYLLTTLILSNAVTVYIYRYRPLRDELYKEQQERE